MSTLTNQPLQTLLELVQQHKLDPWDVDIEKLSNVYLRRVREMQELDLRASGRALLSASVLLRIKSDYVLNGNGKGDSVEGGPDDMIDFDFPDLDFGQITIVQHTPRKITLVDLLGALQEALAEMPAKKQLRSKKMEKILRILSEYDVNIEKHIEELYKRISSLAASGEHITLFALVEERTRLAVARTLLLLLFLCADGKVVLEQPEQFGDITVLLPVEGAEDGR